MREKVFTVPGLSDEGKLYFALLGPPQVYIGDRLLAFPSRKALALLIYLAVEPGKHARKTLSIHGREWSGRETNYPTCKVELEGVLHY